MLSLASSVSSKDILKGLGRYDREVKEEANPDITSISYKKIFNPNVAKFLTDKEVVASIAEYAENYNRLIDESTYFRRGIFNHNNASTIATSLTKNGWFDSGHSVNLNNSGVDEQIKSEADLVSLIQGEKDKILNDEVLLKRFEKIDKLASANVAVKDFRDLVTENKFIIPELADTNKLKLEIWISYLQNCRAEYQTLMGAYDQGKERIEEIIKIARKEASRWKAVIDQFNSRFKVPFEVTMNNQDDVILKREAPKIGYKFKSLEDDREIVIDETPLRNVLSNGERRALYILNIIFEVEARIEDGIKSLFIIDDIADSFDYKNKYAIIEYLKDISNNPLFTSIILTHNFDFYRTIRSRLQVRGAQKMLSSRTSSGIRLVQDSFGDNPFSAWRNELANPVNCIASIPFIRNLAEYAGNKSLHDDLTKLLHLKPDTGTIKMKDLEAKYKSILDTSVEFTLPDAETPVIDKIHATADEISAKENDTIALKDKVVLSMSIRLLAEKLMIDKISEPEFVAGLRSGQTGKLLKKFKAKFSTDSATILLVERVQLMTPENIHINSFMFEPILDMSNSHLKTLHADIKVAQIVRPTN